MPGDQRIFDKVGTRASLVIFRLPTDDTAAVAAAVAVAAFFCYLLLLLLLAWQGLRGTSKTGRTELQRMALLM